MYLIQMKKLKNKLILTQDKYKMLDKYTDSRTMEEIPNTLVAKKFRNVPNGFNSLSSNIRLEDGKIEIVK